MTRVTFGFVLWLSLSSAPASGVFHHHGASATGMAEARTAFSDDPNAVYFNPAAITELPGLQLQIGTTGILPYISYEAANDAPFRYYYISNDGQTEKVPINDGQNNADAKLRGFTPVHLYGSYRIGETGISLGFGLNNPFGLATYWPGDWDGRFIALETEMQFVCSQPVIAIDLARLAGFKDRFKLSLAVGYDLLIGATRVVKRIDLRFAETLSNGTVREPWGEMRFSGTTTGHGWNAALFGELPGWLSFGASLRSGFTVPFNGTARFSFNPAGDEARQLLDTQIPDSVAGELTAHLPLQLNLGVAFLGVSRLRVALDLYAVLFSETGDVEMKFACADTTCPDLKREPIAKKFQDSYQLSLGTEFWATEALALRAGYAMVISPVPAETYSPDMPDGRQDLISIGIGYRANRWKIDASYMLGAWAAKKDNDVGKADSAGPNGKANGRYSTVLHMVAVSGTVAF